MSEYGASAAAAVPFSVEKASGSWQLSGPIGASAMRLWLAYLSGWLRPSRWPISCVAALSKSGVIVAREQSTIHSSDMRERTSMQPAHCRVRLSLVLIVCMRVKRRGGPEAPAPLDCEPLVLLALPGSPPALSTPWTPLTRRMALTTLVRARSARRLRRSTRVPRAMTICAAERRTVETTTTKRATTHTEKMSLIKKSTTQIRDLSISRSQVRMAVTHAVPEVRTDSASTFELANE
eukprot:scaffold88466_cov67-Phaeocystis_antarctica.AAC.7